MYLGSWIAGNVGVSEVSTNGDEDRRFVAEIRKLLYVPTTEDRSQICAKEDSHGPNYLLPLVTRRIRGNVPEFLK